MPEPLVITYTHLHARDWYPVRGPGARTGHGSTMVATAEATLRVVDPDDAPLAFTLRTRTDETVTFRVVDGELMRPLRRPGFWDGCLVPEFRVLALGMEPWRDSPFGGASPPRTGMAKPLVEQAQPPKEDVKRWGGDDIPVRRAEIEGRLAGLAVIGGVVHQPVDMPRLVLKRQAGGIGLSWSTRACDGTHDPDGGEVGYASDEFTRPGAARDGIGWRNVTFGIDRQEEAHAFGSAVAEATGKAYLRNDVVEWLDRAVLPGSGEPDPVLDMATELHGTFLDLTWRGVNGYDRSSVERWLDLRDMAARMAETPDAETMRAAFDLLITLLDGIEGDAATLLRQAAPGALALRWEAVEMHRDLTEVPGLEDGSLEAFSPG